MKSAAAFKILFAVSLIGASVGGFVYQSARAPESSPVSRGAHLANAAGCFACHGQGEQDPRANLRFTSTDTWRRGGIDPLWAEGLLDADEVIDWVTHGVPERRRARHQSLLIQMPAYGDDGHLTAEQIEDIAAWAVAEGLRRSYVAPSFSPLKSLDAVDQLSEDELLQRGDGLAREMGCYQCHGELGQGAVANLASFKGYIPGFQGNDFAELTANGDPTEVRHWIEHGRGIAIEQGPLGGIAQKYFAQQAIPMPAYGDALDDIQTELLVRYVLYLQQRGPLDAKAVETIARTLASDEDDDA